jgi:hypothetical protein
VQTERLRQLFQSIARPEIIEMANKWVTHRRDEVEQAFGKGFELAIKEVADSGFVCDSPPAILAGKAVSLLLRVVEGLPAHQKPTRFLI